MITAERALSGKLGDLGDLMCELFPDGLTARAPSMRRRLGVARRALDEGMPVERIAPSFGVTVPQLRRLLHEYDPTLGLRIAA